MQTAGLYRREETDGDCRESKRKENMTRRRGGQMEKEVRVRGEKSKGQTNILNKRSRRYKKESRKFEKKEKI